MFDRSLLKSNAKDALKRFYGTALVVLIILNVISTLGSNLTSNLDPDEFSEAVSEVVMDPSESNMQEITDEFNEMLVDAYSPSWHTIANIAIVMLVTNILAVGSSRFYLRAREYPANISDLFYGYQNNFGNVALTMGCRYIFNALWYMLFIIPGIVKSYEYSMIPYILAENPNISRKRAFELSKEMTKGYKGELFVLDLSFIGWAILGGLCCGIGTFFLQPYIDATKAEAYTFLKARVLSSGNAAPEDFPGMA